MAATQLVGAKPVLFTIGYEGRTLDDFLAVLRAEHVDLLVDVRELPLSRKPGFSKRRLSEALAGVEIEYRHERRLGNPKENREPFRSGLPQARSRFVGILQGASRDAFEDIAELAAVRRVALLCFERAHGDCHRSCISTLAAAENPELTVREL